MKRKAIRFVIVFAAVCLSVMIGILPAYAAKKLNDIVDVNNYPVEIDTTLSCDEAFSKGNEQYKNGDYEAAKSYYLLALKNIKQSKVYNQGEVCNNLALAMLHLEENEAAYDLCRFILETKQVKTNQDRFGAMMNLLVAAQANGIPAAQELSDAAAKGFFRFKDVITQYSNKPGAFTKLLNGLLYNVMYMDMERDIYDGAVSFYYLPYDSLKNCKNADLMKDLAKLTGGKAKPKKENMREDVNAKATRNQYFEYVKGILKKANNWNEKRYGEEDPDINLLIEYLEALKAEQT